MLGVWLFLRQRHSLYAIVDIETTGSVATQDRITEIAIFKHDGTQIIDQYNTFVNPERSIPPFITKLTGISNEMVKNAPKFFEVAKEIIEFTKECVFVAHNVNFDYSFIKKEFNYLGYNYQRKTLCTVRLSRKLIPGLPSYSLGKLSKSLNIELPQELRHRAVGDAKATADLFTILMKNSEKEGQNALFESELKKNLMPPNIELEIIDELPQETGVYYFLDKEGKVIYVGKSKNIKNRIIKHFSVDYKSKKAIDFKAAIYSITYELTGSELVALLLESDEIKRLLPKFNRAQRRSAFPYGLFAQSNSDGYINLSVERVDGNDKEPISTYSTSRGARSTLHRFLKEYMLCENLAGLGKPSPSCLMHQINKCRGACAQLETPEEYNIRVNQLIKRLSFKQNNAFIIGRGRRFDESSVVQIKDGFYKGFGYFENDLGFQDVAQLEEYVKFYQANKDTHQIIKNYLRKNKSDKIIKY